MVEMRDGLNVTDRTLATVVVADGGGARCRSFASIIGPAVVGAGIAVVSSGSSGWCSCGHSRGGCRGRCSSRRVSCGALVLQSLVQIVRMVEMRDGLLVSDRALATVVIADRGSACRRSFTSSIGPAVVSAGIAVVGSRGGGWSSRGLAFVLQFCMQLRCSVTQVSNGLEVTSRTFAGVLITSGGSARPCSHASSIGPAEVSAGVAVVSGRGSCGSKGGRSRGGCRGRCSSGHVSCGALVLQSLV
jgi:hypothetical protein